MIAPPLLVSFTSIENYKIAIPSDMLAEAVLVSDFVERSLPPVVSLRSLAVLFGYSPKLIKAIIDNNKKYYREFTIRTGKKRRSIKAPKVILKIIQKWIGFHLSNAIIVSDHVYGFVSGRSAPLAAVKHCDAKWVFSVDLEDFFPSTSENVVKSAFSDLGYTEKACNLIAQLCCYEGALAQGAPSSPAISNLVMKKLDDKLVLLANKYSCRFTRYVDDIVFSGVDKFPQELPAEIEKIFQGTCWSLSKDKCKLSELDKGQRLKVHGLLVHGSSPRLTKGYRNKIRAYRHLVESNKVDSRDLQRLKGHLNYASKIEDLVDSLG